MTTFEKPLGADIDLLAPMRKMKAADVLLAACEEALDVFTRCDGEIKQINPCTDDEWNHAVAQLRTAIGFAKGETV